MKKSYLLSSSYVLTATIISAIVVRVFVIDSFTVSSYSMAPAISNGDYIFVNKLAYTWQEPGRGDIIVGSFRNMPNQKIIKRIVGLPGEWIEVSDGIASVKSRREEEWSTVTEFNIEVLPDSGEKAVLYRLDPHEYFLLGDSRTGSADSREFGPVDRYDMDGKAILRVRPIDLSIQWIN